MRMLQPYLSSRKSAQLDPCMRQLRGLLMELPGPTERALHIRTFAGALAEASGAPSTELMRRLHFSLQSAAPPPLGGGAPLARGWQKQPMAAPARAAAAPPLVGDSTEQMAQLSALGVQLDVRLSDLYVWDGAPHALHWSKAASCAHEAHGKREPALWEVARLPLCMVCMDAVASDRLADDADDDSQRVAEGRRGVPQRPVETRDQAELVLLHVLLRRQSVALRSHAARLCEDYRVVLDEAARTETARTETARTEPAHTEAAGPARGGVGRDGAQTPRAATRLRTKGRRELLRRLVAPPTADSVRAIFEAGDSAGAGAAASDGEASVLGGMDLALGSVQKRPSDDLQRMAKQWLKMATNDPNPRASKENLATLLELCVSTIAARARYDPVLAKVTNARAQVNELSAALSAVCQGDPRSLAQERAIVAQAAASLSQLSTDLAEHVVRLQDEEAAAQRRQPPAEPAADGGRDAVVAESQRGSEAS